MTASAKPLVIVYDTKPYDRENLSAAPGVDDLTLQFNKFRPEPETALTADGAYACAYSLTMSFSSRRSKSSRV